MSDEEITRYYEKDHDRLDSLFKTFQKEKSRDFGRAREAFVQFKFGLQRHIVWEEEILFPAFESKTGIGETGPTAVMRMEHRRIGAALESIHEKVAAGQTDSDRSETELLETLSNHNQKEEQILYPAIDHLLNPEEKKEIFRRMEAVPPERFETCCSLQAGPKPALRADPSRMTKIM